VSLTPVENMPPVSLIPVAICNRCRWHRRKFAAGIVDTGGNFATGINNTSKIGGKFATGVVDIGGNFVAGVVDAGGKFVSILQKIFLVQQCNKTDIKEAIVVRRVELGYLLPTLSCHVPGRVWPTAVCATYKRVLHAAFEHVCPTPSCAAVYAASGHICFTAACAAPERIFTAACAASGHICSTVACVAPERICTADCAAWTHLTYCCLCYAVIGLYSTFAVSTSTLSASTSYLAASTSTLTNTLRTLMNSIAIFRASPSTSRTLQIIAQLFLYFLNSFYWKRYVSI
jgi:hypothetical protein